MSRVCVFALALLFAAAGADRLRGNGPANASHGAANSSSAGIAAPQAVRVAVPHALPAANSSVAAKSGQVPATATRPPRIFFLFLAVDKVSNLDVWNSFFQTAPVGQFRAFIHCKLPSCVSQVAGSALEVVPTVPSYYCTDLVSPMNQLLAQAMHLDAAGLTNPYDKFAFVSDSTLPAKPFSELYATLASRQGSDFCVFPSNEWADVPSPNAMGIEIVAKHHQWITLDRAHAQKVTELWAKGHMHNFMSYFGLNHNQYVFSNNSYADSRNFGCLDEFWHMAALYGTMSTTDQHTDRLVDLYQFTSSPLRIAPNAGWQGKCDTFVIWSKYLHAGGDNPFERLHWSLDSASIPHGGNSARPGWWDTISTTGINAIRNSEFLFVRKFIDNPHLVNGGDFATAYAQIVFA